MIDYGLLMSVIVGFGGPALVGNWWQVAGRDEPVGFLDVAVGPALAGLAVGRLTTLILDDPNSIGSISDMLIIRSGVEFWPGAAAASAVVLLSANLGLVSTSKRLSDLAPLAMIGYAGYEAACIFRDGCFGPDSPVGLRPPGLTTTMLPIGWFVAVAVALSAIGVRSLATSGNRAIVVVPAGLLAVASARSVGSIWLPHVGDGLTRQHLTSIGVLVSSAIAVVVAVLIAVKRSPRLASKGTPT